MRFFTLLFILRAYIAAGAQSKPAGENSPSTTPLALQMLDSIIAREQGVTVNASVKTSVIEAGLLLMGIDEVLENVALNNALNVKYTSYLELVMSGLIPALMNVTSDKTSPLDEFSVGTQFIKQ
jgi:unsaturated rhamnogalacturonyl hydrolase